VAAALLKVVLRGTALRSAGIVSALLVAAALISGCENAYENLSLGDWQRAGAAEPPRWPTSGEFMVTTLAAGEGRAAKAGDLVKAQVIVLSQPRNTDDPPRPRESKVVWVWLGREVWPSETPSIVDLETFGDLGSGRARKAFIGRQLNERFRIDLEAGAGGYDELPLQGIISVAHARLEGGALVNGRMLRARDWRSVLLARLGDGPASAEITILNICDAQLFRRTGFIVQKGWIPTIGNHGYDFNRQGTVGWTAVDAQCPTPDGHVRFEAGPFHHSTTISDRSQLAGWERTYIKLRPAEKFPNEWERTDSGDLQH
jgi:hypothetical protein